MLIFKRDVWPSFTFNNYKKPNFLNWLLSAKDATKLLSKDEKVIDMKLYSSTFPFFGAFNVHSLALSAPLHSVRADCSQSAHSAFTLRSHCVHHLFSIHLSLSLLSFIFIRISKMKWSVFASHSKMSEEPVRKDEKKPTYISYKTSF